MIRSIVQPPKNWKPRTRALKPDLKAVVGALSQVGVGRVDVEPVHVGALGRIEVVDRDDRAVERADHVDDGVVGRRPAR